MIHHEKRVQIGWGKPVNLFFFGDLQWGTPGFSKEAWEEFKAEFKSTPNAWALGLGDYGDFVRPSMRAKLGSPLAHDDSTREQLDGMVRHEHDKILDLMGFLEGRLIGLHDGHHNWVFADGTNATQRFCTALRAPYLGWMAYTRLILHVIGHSKGTNGYAYMVLSMHGTGNGRHISSDVNWLMNNVYPNWDADLMVKGHSCKAISWFTERNYPRHRGTPGVDKKIIRFLNVGGFHGGYTDGWNASYVERAGFAPQPISWGVARIRLTNAKAVIGTKKSCIGLDVEAVSRGPGAFAKLYEGGR